MNINRVWLIPKNAEKPADARKSSMKKLKIFSLVFYYGGVICEVQDFNFR